MDPVHAPEKPRDWKTFAADWMAREDLGRGWVVLTEGPSDLDPHANPRLELLDVR